VSSVLPQVTIFGPHPLLSVTLEAEGAADGLHLHAAGQGVWVTRMAGELGALPVLCGFAGGEVAAALVPLLEELPGELRLTRTTGSSGWYVTDRRAGERRLLAQAPSPPPSRHELDDLVSATIAAALRSRVLVVCNAFPGDRLPVEVYERLVADVQGSGASVIVDLSTPRLDAALRGRPDLVKLNDWELAEFVRAPIGEPAQMRAAVGRLRALGAGSVLVTRGGDPAVLFRDDAVFELVPPQFGHGAREGCGDTMVGAIAAALAHGRPLEDALVLGAAAGAANFLRHGLGTGAREVVEELESRVQLRPLAA
jgi:1-phosphofructokinase